jgi:hypothetical protein
VDAWNPAYGTSFEPGDGGPSKETSAKIDLTVELPADSWRPVVPPADVQPPTRVYLVDGVQRRDATLWSVEEDGSSLPGLAASFAAGVVRCDLRDGGAEVVDARVERRLFTASRTAPGLSTGQINYRLHQVDITDPVRLGRAVQAPLTDLEIRTSESARGGDDDDLLIVDGPLRSRRQLPRTIGYIKTQQGSYLPAAQATVVTQLKPGERSPVFRMAQALSDGYSWYLRLPGPAGAPWTGIARVQCSLELAPGEAIALAGISAVTLPRLASSSYKDPRAPQNLVPIGGLERRLRAMLGDSRLLHRSLLAAARL